KCSTGGFQAVIVKVYPVVPRFREAAPHVHRSPTKQQGAPAQCGGVCTGRSIAPSRPCPRPARSPAPMVAILQRPTLVINRNWQPVNVATVARALTLVWNGT